jgi:hypothetical protein
MGLGVSLYLCGLNPAAPAAAGCKSGCRGRQDGQILLFFSSSILKLNQIVQNICGLIFLPIFVNAPSSV